jgi:Rrf2 family nitric oxide-sensitive transcriptional repressor
MIRLNLATDFALRTLLYVASQPGTWVSTRAVAEFYGISADHVSKVAQTLTHAGYLKAGRGRTGGLQLGRAPGDVTVGDIVELFEGPVGLLECVTRDSMCVIQPSCRLRQVLDQAGKRLIRELKEVTLADLIRPASAGLVELTTLEKPLSASREAVLVPGRNGTPAEE